MKEIFQHGNVSWNIKIQTIVTTITLWILITLILNVEVECESSCQQHKTVFLTNLTGNITDGPTKYESNQRCEWLIQSPNVTKYPFITLKFLSIKTECNYDYVMVYDGDSYESPLLATLSGDSSSVSRQQVLAKSGKMLIYYFSDINTNNDGFEAFFTVDECPNNCYQNGICIKNRCQCNTGWTGTDCSQHACPFSCKQCRTETKSKKCNCNNGYIGNGCGMDNNPDNNHTWWTMVYDYKDEPGSKGRAGHTGAFIDPYFYIFGGFDMDEPMAELLRYNFQANEWLSLKSSTEPSARFFHTMTVINEIMGFYHFLLFGGELGEETLSNETWTYNAQSNTWRKHIPETWHSVPPALCQHTSALVDLKSNSFVYIFGGRTSSSQDEGLSSDMYRFNWTEKKWERVKYDQSGVKESKLRMAGHSMVYDAVDRSLVVFGGFRMDPDQKAVYSSSVFLYRVDANRWAEVISSSTKVPPFTYNIERLVFHSANIVGDYMIIHGGNTYGKVRNTCYSSKTHFYNLRCHAWVEDIYEAMPKPQSIRPTGRYSHTASIMNDSILLIHGGYNGIMSSELSAYKLPKLNSQESANDILISCSKHINEVSCNTDFINGCVWKNRVCYNGVELQPSCGSVCSSLKDCLSCTTFRSYVRNSTYDWESQTCGWCVQESRCHHLNGKDNIDVCSYRLPKHGVDSWWDKNRTTLIQNSSQCLTENILPGAIAAEYHSPPNFLQPDNVSYLTDINLKQKGEESTSKTDHVLTIRGFLHPQKFQHDFLYFQLLSTNGRAEIRLGFGDEGQTTVEVETPQRDSSTQIISRAIPLSHLQNLRHFIEIKFTHSGNSMWTGKVEADWATGNNSTNLKFYLLSSSFLEPYQSSLLPASVKAPSCSALSNCLACLTDMSCAWCNSLSECVERNFLDNRPYLCSPTASVATVMPDHAGMITEPGSCTLCSDYTICSHCLTSSNCEWNDENDECVRRGSKGNSTSDPSKCPDLCNLRNDCRSCLASEDDRGGTLECAWCSTAKKCYRITRYHLTAYPFGQCAFWVDDAKQCPVCSEHDTCSSCLQNYECGWCGMSSNPLQGYCSKGGFMNPELKCFASKLPSQYIGNVTSDDDMIWSYSACPDVNECDLYEWPIGSRLHDCHSNAFCTNTEGSYTCRCKFGFDGDGILCERTCLMKCVHGNCSGYPDYSCECELGWTSKNSEKNDTQHECDIDCGCNLLSSCNTGQGVCDMCLRNTVGATCGQCLAGHFRGADLGSGCQPCDCNSHGIKESGLCDRDTGRCYCQHNTMGPDCETCVDGYYGNPRNGGKCYLKCDGRVQIQDERGAFGSWNVSRRKDGSLLRREKEKIDITVTNCEWFINISAVDQPARIKIVVEKEINISCYINQVLVYDGIPGTESMKLLASLCGSNWKNNIEVFADSGFATIHYMNIIPSGSYGFNATFETFPYFPRTLIQTSKNASSTSEIYSGDTADYDTLDSISDSSNQSFTNLCPEKTGTYAGGWPIKCSEQGECKNGVCHCSNNFTGPDCLINKTNFLHPANLQVVWDYKMAGMNNTSSPTERVGSILVSMEHYLWLLSGADSEDALSDFWRYDPKKNEWELVEINSEVKPSARFYHASASHLVEDEFYIHGGVLHNGRTNPEMWMFNIDKTWHEVNTSSSLPSLAGHTMTFCGDVTTVYIIGGYNSNSGYNHNVWILNVTDGEVSVVHRLVHTPLVYGHTTVCDWDSGQLYIYGGMETSVLQLPAPTSMIKVFDTRDLAWKPVFSQDSDSILPTAVAFHAAVPYKSEYGSGMLIIGGKLLTGETSNEIWFFKYGCNTWFKLMSSIDDSITLVRGIPASASVATVDDKHYIYGGLLNGKFHKRMIVISDVKPCLSAKTPIKCESLKLGCKIRNINNSFICLQHDISSKHEPMQSSIGGCESDIKPNCSILRDCKSCRSIQHGGKNICYWCNAKPNIVTDYHGRCQSDICDEDKLIFTKKDCNHCTRASCSSCDKKPGCVWKETENMDSTFNKIIRSYSCHEVVMKSDREFYYTTAMPTNPTMQPAVPMFHETRRCPGSCESQHSCSNCLGFDDRYDTWRYCVWSPGLNRCINTAFVPLLCQPGGICGTLASKGSISCPSPSCSKSRSCWDCINQLHCLWIQIGNIGHCQDVDIKETENSDLVTKWYYGCPAENECWMNLDDCMNDDINKEKCHDLEEGYECLCQEGYDRNSHLLPCTPVCSAGCYIGECIEPNTCECKFGFTGLSCNISCQCNHRSDCMDAQHTNVCLNCHNNTVGDQCESCMSGYVGDPTENKTCVKCKDVCKGKSESCTSKTSTDNMRGPTINDVICINCEDNSQGDLCQECKDGYFMLKGRCRKCQCNGHSDTCDRNTGGFCKCQNYTTTSDPKCLTSGQYPYPDDCWMKQCDKCAISYQGNPKKGGNCYRQVIFEQNLCFSADSPFPCPAVDYGSSTNSHTVNTLGITTHNFLPAGHALFFALNPKYTNVDIRILVDITFGELSLFLSDRPNAFRIITNEQTKTHTVVPSEKLIIDERFRRNLDLSSSDTNDLKSLSSDEAVRMQRSFLDNVFDEKMLADDYSMLDNDVVVLKPAHFVNGKKLKLFVLNATDFNSFATLSPNSALMVEKITHRLVITIPHHGYDLTTDKFFLILLGKESRAPIENDMKKEGQGRRTKRATGDLVEYVVLDKTAGQFVFRQDQVHIDLFVFFSVFFSCFFLFLAICIVTWKGKQAMAIRQERLARHIEMQHMASRPFASAYIILDDYIPQPVFYTRRGRKNYRQISSVTPMFIPNSTTQLFQARSCPIFVNEDGAGTSGINAAEKRPNSLSLPTSPHCKQVQRNSACPIAMRRGADRLSLHLSSNSSGKENGSSILSTKSISPGTDYSNQSTEKLLIVRGDHDPSTTKIPLFNSTTTYVKQNPDCDCPGQLTPLSSCSSRTPSPVKSTTYIHPYVETVPTIVSLDKSGKFRTFGKRKTMPPQSSHGATASTIFEPRTKYLSTPNLPDRDDSSLNSGVVKKLTPGQKSFSNSKNVVGQKYDPRNTLGRFSMRGRTKHQPKTQQKHDDKNRHGPLSCEVTENGFASVNTVLLQLPGGAKAPVFASLGSALMTTRNMCCPSFSNDASISKQHFKSRSSKIL